MLCLRRTVEAHDEVVAGVMFDLVERKGLGKEEDAPIGQATDDASAGEDDASGGFGDSGVIMSMRGKS